MNNLKLKIVANFLSNLAILQIYGSYFVNDVKAQIQKDDPHLQSSLNTNNLVEQIIDSIQKNDIKSAWQTLVDYTEQNYTDLNSRKILIVFQQLCYAEFKINLLKMRYEKDKDDTYFLNELNRILSLLNRIILEKNEFTEVFSDKRKQIIQQCLDLKDDIDKKRLIGSYLNSANKACASKDHKSEAKFLERAIACGAQLEDRLEQCLLFIRGIESFEKQDYENSIAFFSKIQKNDVHFSMAASKIEQAKYEIFQRDGLAELERVWQSQDWEKIRDLTRELKANPRYISDSLLGKEIESTFFCLNERESYLAKKSFSLEDALEHINNIKRFLQENKPIFFKEFSQWIERENEKIIPIVKDKFENLFDDIKKDSDLYWNCPVSQDEIEKLDDSSDYNLLQKKFTEIKLLYEKILKADRIAKLLYGEFGSDSLKSIKNKIESHVRLLTHLLGKIARINMGGLLKNDTIIKICQSALCLPVVPEVDGIENVNGQDIIIKRHHVEYQLNQLKRVKHGEE